ncbi:MAG: CapA family protein, partial [Actinomycetota bacterium]
VLARARVTGGRGRVSFRPAAPGLYRLRLRVADGRPRRLTLRVRPVSLVAVGDVSPGSAIDAVRRHGPSWHWQAVGGWLRKQDIVVANLETAIGGAGAPWPGKGFNFLAPPSTVRAAARVGGVDVVSVANNHALDFGRETFLAGLRAARKAGITPFGGGARLDRALQPAVVERGGLRIAFVGFNAVTPYGFWATPGAAGNAPATPQAVTGSVRGARRGADLVVAYFHWGIELTRRPVAEQTVLARTAFAAGADVVLGAHPHVVQPVERRGAGLVAWSLGNFLFAPGSAAGTRSTALRMLLDARGVRGWQVRAVRIVGTRPVFDGAPR